MNSHRNPTQSNVNWNNDDRRSNQHMNQNLLLQTHWSPLHDTAQNPQANDDTFIVPTLISHDRLHYESVLYPDQITDEYTPSAQATLMNQAEDHAHRGHSLAIADHALTREGGHSDDTYLGQPYHTPSAPRPNGEHAFSASSHLDTLGSDTGDDSFDFLTLYPVPGMNGNSPGATMLGDYRRYGVPSSHHTSGVPFQYPNDPNDDGSALDATYNISPHTFHESADFHRPVDADARRVPVAAHARVHLPTGACADGLIMIDPRPMDQSDVAYGTAAPHDFVHSGTVRGATQPTPSPDGISRNNGERESSEAPSESSCIGRNISGRRRAGEGRSTGRKSKGRKDACFVCQLAQVGCVKLPDNPALCVKCKKKGYSTCYEGNRAEAAKRPRARPSSSGQGGSSKSAQ